MWAQTERVTVAALAANDPKYPTFDAEQVDDDTSALGHGSLSGARPKKLRGSWPPGRHNQSGARRISFAC